MHVAGEILALVAALVTLTSAIGVMRLRIPLSRLHALTAASTVGIVLMAIAAALALPTLNDATSALLAGGLQLLTLPVASNLLARSSHKGERAGYVPGARRRRRARRDPEASGTRS